MNWTELEVFLAQCTELGVKPPAALVRGRELRDLATAHIEDPQVPPLSASDDDFLGYFESLAIRRFTAQDGWTPGLKIILPDIDQALLPQIQADSAGDLDRIVQDLQKRFAELSKPIVTGARQYGFTLSTTSDDIIARRDVKAVDAWADVREAWHRIAPIAHLRQQMSRTFQVAPIAHAAAGGWAVPIGGIDYSVAFAGGDNWTTDGTSYVDGDLAGTIDWLKLAAEGLRLNTPTDVAELQAKRRKRDARR